MIKISQDFNSFLLSNFSLKDQGIIFDVYSQDKFTVVSSASETTQTNSDTEDVTQTSANIYNEANIIAFHTIPSADHKFVSLDPSIATIDSNGAVSRVTDGVARILVTVSGYTKRLDVEVSEKVATNEIISSTFVTGSLGRSAVDNLDTLLVGKNPNDHKLIYTTQDHANKLYVRNPNVWCSGLDLTCISPWNSQSANRRAGTLVTPQHIINAAHYPIAVGSTVRFVDAAGSVYDRYVLGRKSHPNYPSTFPHYPDLQVCLLSDALPANIKPCKVLPSNISDFLVNTQRGLPPCLVIDQEEKALVSDLYLISGDNAAYSRPVDAKRLEFFENLIGGDSGNPSFILLDEGNGVELVLVNVWTYGNAGAGTAVSNHISELNQMIADLDTAAGISTGYTLQTIDLSSFPTY